MNQDQFLGILRAILPAGLAYVVGRGWVPAGAAADVGAGVIAVASAAWSYASHTDGAKLAAVTALPDVRKIIVASSPSNDAVRQASGDSSQPKITPAP
jgi:hypothetical protein